MSTDVKRIINCGVVTSVYKNDYDDNATYKWKNLVRYDHKLWYHASKDMTTGIKPSTESLIWILLSSDGSEFVVCQIEFELQADKWEAIVGSDYNYMYKIESDIIRDGDQAIVNFTSNYETQVIPAIIWSQCEVGNGYLKLFCKVQPTDIIKGVISLTTDGRFVVE